MKKTWFDEIDPTSYKQTGKIGDNLCEIEPTLNQVGFIWRNINLDYLYTCVYLNAPDHSLETVFVDTLSAENNPRGATYFKQSYRAETFRIWSYTNKKHILVCEDEKFVSGKKWEEE